MTTWLPHLVFVVLVVALWLLIEWRFRIQRRYLDDLAHAQGLVIRDDCPDCQAMLHEEPASLDEARDPFAFDPPKDAGDG